MNNWFAGISETVPSLKQESHAKSEISSNLLNQHWLLGFSNVLELLQATNRTTQLKTVLAIKTEKLLLHTDGT